MIHKWFLQAGGLLYHLRGLKYRDSLWREFRDQLLLAQNDWLQELESSQKENLILLGGSGGHCLSQTFLQNFSNIIHVDVDPLAAHFFKRHLPHSHFTFSQGDLFNKDFSLLDQLLQRYSPVSSSWMWCNLLGQVGLSHSDQDTHFIFQKINEKMKDRSWMSFHDLYSVKTRSSFRPKTFSSCYENWSGVEKDLHLISDKKLELIDHLTKDQFALKKKRILLWPLLPMQLHFIECGFNSRPNQVLK